MAFKLGPLQEKWLQELESGKHEQVGQTLCVQMGNERSYCCLGVACEFVLGMRPEVESRRGDGLEIISFYGFASVMPSWEKLGLRSENGSFIKGLMFNHRYFSCLTEMNDFGMSFKDIAAYIRSNPENVFVESL